MPLFDFEDLGPVEVKGKDEPVQTYRVIRSKAESGSLRGIEGLDAPLIGRAQEMETLQGLIAGLQQGAGWIVSVMGDAGLGKSRLIAELRRASLSDGAKGTEGLSWHEARSMSYSTSTPYAPFVRLFRDYFDLGADDTDQDHYQKITARLAELPPQAVDQVAPFVATLLGIPLTGEDQELVKYLQPPQLRERTFNAVRGLVEIMATERPLVLVLEDLHWTDPTSLELTEHLMPLADTLPWSTKWNITSGGPGSLRRQPVSSRHVANGSTCTDTFLSSLSRSTGLLSHAGAL